MQTGRPDRRSTALVARPSSAGRPEPIRTCVGCRRRDSRSTLLRIVAAADGDTLLVDERRRLPGRGAWLHQDAACLDQAEKRRALPRALRRPGPLDAAGVRSYVVPPLAGVHTTTTDESGSYS